MKANKNKTPRSEVHIWDNLYGESQDQDVIETANTIRRRAASRPCLWTARAAAPLRGPLMIHWWDLCWDNASLIGLIANGNFFRRREKPKKRLFLLASGQNSFGTGRRSEHTSVVITVGGLQEPKPSDIHSLGSIPHTSMLGLAT